MGFSNWKSWQILYVTDNGLAWALFIRLNYFSTFVRIKSCYFYKLESFNFLLKPFEKHYLKCVLIWTFFWSSSLWSLPQSTDQKKLCISTVFSPWKVKNNCWNFLTYLFPIHPFSTPWKYQKTVKVEKGYIGNKWLIKFYLFETLTILTLFYCD